MSKRYRSAGPVDDLENGVDTPRNRPQRRGGKLFRFAAVVLLVLAVVVALLPTIVSMTSLGPSLVASAAKGQIDGTLQVTSVSIGWLSPVRASGITIKDKEEQTIATIDSLVIGKSLLALIANSQDLGTITIDKPQLLVVARPDGSNVEDLLAPLLARPSSGGALPTVTVDVQEGLVRLVDGATEQSWELTPLDVHIESPRDAQNAWNVSIKTKLEDAGLVANVTQILGDSAATRATIEADRFPLDPLQPLLARVIGPVQLSGSLSGRIDAELADGGKQQSVLLQNVDALQIAFASERLLGQDVVQLAQAKGNGSAKLIDGVWQLRDLEIQSEVAALIGSGDVRVSDFSSGKAIPQTDCDIQGVVDLARLMQLLPNTLHARQGVQVASGQARVSLTSQAVAGGRRFAVTLSTEDVQASNNGRPISLEEPVQLTAALVQSPQGWQIENIDASSSFLTAQANGTFQQGNLTLQGDLDKLAAELDQFVDLGDARLAGQLGGSLQWQPDAGGTLATSGKVNFRSFQLSLPGVMPWQEENLAIELKARGVSPTAYTLSSGKLTVKSGTDELDVVLDEAVSAARGGAPVPIDVRLTGNLATWTPRLQAFVPLAGWQIAGPVNITAKGTASAAKIDIAEARFDVQKLQIQGHGLHVYEPQLAGELKGSYDVASGAANIVSALVQTETVAASAEKLALQAGKQFKISGFIALRGDVGRMMAWITDPRVPPVSQFTGETEAEATFTFVGGVTQANLKGQVTNLAYLTRTPQPIANAGRVPAREVANAAAWQTAWSEPLITFGGDAAYDLAKDSISLDKMQAAAGTSAVVASGRVSQLASRCQLDLTGEVRYDLATWSPKVRPLLGPTFEMTGAGAKTFEVHGPLWGGSSGETSLLPLALTGKAGLGWEGAQWMALQVGPAELAVELKDSTIFVQPTKIPLSQGTLQMSPALELKGRDWLVTHGPAMVIDHVVITPEMCDTWIKYVCPPLAGATVAQGKFSVDVENAAVPINQPTELDTKGKFIVHNVSVGPGPLARTLIGAVDQVKSFTNGEIGLEGLAGLAGSFLPGGTPTVPEATGKQWLELPEQQVPVEVIDGRVHHTGLTLKTKEFVLRSTGSVGIADQSLQLICEVPLRDEWLKDPKFAGLKGQTLKIPVKGTISQPRVDVSAAFGGLVGLGTAGIKGAIGGQIDQGLQQGTGAVQGEIGKVQDKVQTEIDKAKKKAEDELRNGLKNLFGK